MIGLALSGPAGVFAGIAEKISPRPRTSRVLKNRAK